MITTNDKNWKDKSKSIWDKLWMTRKISIDKWQPIQTNQLNQWQISITNGKKWLRQITNRNANCDTNYYDKEK